MKKDVFRSTLWTPSPLYSPCLQPFLSSPTMVLKLSVSQNTGFSLSLFIATPFCLAGLTYRNLDCALSQPIINMPGYILLLIARSIHQPAYVTMSSCPFMFN